MPDIKLTKFEALFIFLFAVCFITMVGISAKSGTEPDVGLLILVWCLGAVFMFMFIKRLFGNLFSINFPYSYKDIRDNYENPAYSFKARLYKVGFMRFRGYSAKFDIYDNAVVVSCFGRCQIITDFNNIKFSKNFLSYTVNIDVGNSHLVCGISKKQKILLDSKRIVQNTNEGN